MCDLFIYLFICFVNVSALFGVLLSVLIGCVVRYCGWCGIVSVTRASFLCD
ncbi:unnamed protein product [Moritella viscosa]|nr:unnamed protein product [Moritella viscosa]SHO28342.1 unnamed protein product [Moritella viscosa]